METIPTRNQYQQEPTGTNKESIQLYTIKSKVIVRGKYNPYNKNKRRDKK